MRFCVSGFRRHMFDRGERSLESSRLTTFAIRNKGGPAEGIVVCAYSTKILFVYYDMVRTKCMETILRHYASSGDSYDLCILENLLIIPVLHRQDSIFGNESMVTLAELQHGMFVHPRVTEKEE